MINTIERSKTALRTDFPRWATIASGIVYATFFSYVTIFSWLHWKESDLRDLVLVIFITIGWAWIWTGTVRFLDTMKNQALGFILLIAFCLVIFWIEMYNISATNTPVEINSFAYKGLFIHSLRDDANMVGIATVSISIITSVLRSSRLRAIQDQIYSQLRNGIVMIRNRPSRYLVIVGGVMWTGEHLSLFVDTGEMFFGSGRNIFEVFEFVYIWSNLNGTYILYLEAIVLVLMIEFADRLHVQRSLRIYALLGCCIVTVIAYAVSFPWPVPPDYGPMLWSAPALFLLITAAVVAIFTPRDKDAISASSTE